MFDFVIKPMWAYDLFFLCYSVLLCIYGYFIILASQSYFCCMCFFILPPPAACSDGLTAGLQSGTAVPGLCTG